MHPICYPAAYVRLSIQILADVYFSSGIHRVLADRRLGVAARQSLADRDSLDYFVARQQPVRGLCISA